MLQQILRDMWVDPEILAELDEAQKQTLFCKMREEQVRRWRLWDQKLNKEEEVSQKREDTGKKSVQFLEGEDGDPWVWVMGEHADDRSIEDIVLSEAREKARRLAAEEAEELRKSVERELTHLIDYKSLDQLEKDYDISPKQADPIEDTLEIYCTVDDLRQRIQNLQPELKLPNDDVKSHTKIEDVENELNSAKNMEVKNKLNFNFIEGKRDVLQEIALTYTHSPPTEPGSLLDLGGTTPHKGGVSSRVAAWERRVAAARAGEILRGMRQRRAAQVREAERRALHDETLWLEQERKAKEAEHQMREIARRAREEHRRYSVIISNEAESTETCYSESSLALGVGKPPNREAIIDWFRQKELQRGAGLDESNKAAVWFHGLITRSEAESLLQDCAPGSYLVRVSERIWGYAISYRAAQRCKHYLVDASRDTHYQFLGSNQITHKSLADLVKYHRENAITESGQEKLSSPCQVKSPPAIVDGLVR